MKKIVRKVITIYSFTFLIYEFLSIPDPSISILMPIYEWIHQFSAYEGFFICLGTVPVTLIIIKFQQLIYFKDISYSTEQFQEMLLLLIVIVTAAISFFIELRLTAIGLSLGLAYTILHCIYMYKKNKLKG